MEHVSKNTEVHYESKLADLATLEFPECETSAVIPHRQTIMLTIGGLEGITVAMERLMEDMVRVPTMSEALDYIIWCWLEGGSEYQQIETLRTVQ